MKRYARTTLDAALVLHHAVKKTRYVDTSWIEGHGMRVLIHLKFRLLHEALMKGCLRVRLQTIRISDMKPTNTLDFLRVRLLRKLWCSSVLEVLLRT